MTLFFYLFISIILFVFGICGIALNKKSIIAIIMSIELMLLGANFNFLVFSLFLDDLHGQLFSLFILTVAAAESSIGLAILVVFFMQHNTGSLHNIFNLKG
jgi:NADH-quinone oxidoreductase subunit K